MSETMYASHRAMMPDGSIRRVRVKCYTYDGSFAADTAFSTPAYVTVQGNGVKGYVTGREGDPGLEFRPMDSHKHLLPGGNYGRQ